MASSEQEVQAGLNSPRRMRIGRYLMAVGLSVCALTTGLGVKDSIKSFNTNSKGNSVAHSADTLYKTGDNASAKAEAFAQVGAHALAMSSYSQAKRNYRAANADYTEASHQFDNARDEADTAAVLFLGAIGSYALAGVGFVARRQPRSV